MKKIALVLLLAICLSCFGVTAFAEERTAPSLEITYYTVPMRATVSILYAVDVAGYENPESIKIIANKGSGDEEITNSGYTTINGKTCLVFEYSNLSAAEMDTKVKAKVKYGDQVGSTVVEYSVKEFATNYETSGGQYVSLVKAMIAYGDAVKAMQAAN